MTKHITQQNHFVIANWQDVLKTFGRGLQSWRGFHKSLEDVFWRLGRKTSSRCLHQDQCLLRSFCYWNLNGLTAHNSIKITLIKAYITDQNFDIVCLLETLLNSSIKNDHKLKIDGYNLIRSNHPSDSKKGGIVIYYKEHIPLIKHDDLYTLDNCLVTEIRSQREECFLTCANDWLSQSQKEFKIFCTNFDILLNQINDELPLGSNVTGDFNAPCTNWL